MTWRAVGLAALYEWFGCGADSADCQCKSHAGKLGSIQAPRKAVYGQIAAKSLAELVAEHGKALFERNIRHYLGSIGVNTADRGQLFRGDLETFFI